MNKKSIVLALGILAISAFGVIAIPAKASADRAGYVTPYNSTRFDRVAIGGGYNTYAEPSYAPVVAYNTPTTVYSTSGAPKTTVAKKSTATKSTSTATKTDEKINDLTASAVLGNDTFLPSGLVQWIIFAILILLIVILVRKAVGAEDKYHSTPLKHA